MLFPLPSIRVKVVLLLCNRYEFLHPSVFQLKDQRKVTSLTNQRGSRLDYDDPMRRSPATSCTEGARHPL